MSLELVRGGTPKKYIQEIASKISSLKELKDVNKDKLFDNKKKSNLRTPTINTVTKLNDTVSKNSSVYVTPKESTKSMTPVSKRSTFTDTSKTKQVININSKTFKQEIKNPTPTTTRTKSPSALRTSLSSKRKEVTSTTNPSDSKKIGKDKKIGVAKYTNISRYLKKPNTNIDTKEENNISQKTFGNNSKIGELNTSTNNLSNLNDNSNNDSSIIYQKKIIPKKTPQRTGSVDKKVQSMLIRMEEFEEAKQKRLECIKTKKAQEFLSQFKNKPTINEKSKRLIKDDFYSRMEHSKKDFEMKKKLMTKKNDEKIKRALTPKTEKRSKNLPILPLQSVKKQLKWEQERRLKIESLRELEKMNELKDCPFKPEINPKSIKIVYKLEHNRDRNKSSFKNRVSLDDFNLERNKNNKLNLESSSERSEGEEKDTVNDVSNSKKKKKMKHNNYSTNKEEIIIEKLFETRFNMLKLNE